MSDSMYEVKVLRDNIVEVILKDRVYLDISITDAIDTELQKLLPDKKVFQLVMASGPYIVNPEMRNAMSAGDTGIRQLAIAWVSPDRKANEEQEAIVSKLPLPLPIRFFTERQEGLNWLMKLSSAT